MINSKTASPTTLCYQEMMNVYKTSRNCSDHTLLFFPPTPKDVCYFSQVLCLLPKTSGRLLTNHKLSQTFRNPRSLKFLKPQAGSWHLHTLNDLSQQFPQGPCGCHAWPLSTAPTRVVTASSSSPLLRIATLWNWPGYSQGLKHQKCSRNGLRQTSRACWVTPTPFSPALPSCGWKPSPKSKVKACKSPIPDRCQCMEMSVQGPAHGVYSTYAGGAAWRWPGLVSSYDGESFWYTAKAINLWFGLTLRRIKELHKEYNQHVFGIQQKINPCDQQASCAWMGCVCTCQMCALWCDTELRRTLF